MKPFSALTEAGKLRRFRKAAKTLLGQYAFTASRLTLLEAGQHHVYKVEVPGSAHCLLRIQDPRRMSDDSSLLQLHWLKSIGEETGLIVPSPIERPDGSFIAPLEIEGEGVIRRGVLLRWVEGKRSPSAQAFVTPQALQSVGVTVATLHRHAQRFGVPADYTGRQYTPEGFFGPASPLLNGTSQKLLKPEEFAVVMRAHEKVCEAMRQAGRDSDRFGLIHADLEPANWIFHRGDARPIDFDEFGAGHYLFDLLGVLWSHAHWNRYEDYRSWLIEGYRRVRPLPDDEEHYDLFQAAVFLCWMNHGLGQPDEASRQEFARNGAFAVQMLQKFCRL